MSRDGTHRVRVLAALGAVLAIDLLFVCLLALLVDPFVATGVAGLARALGVAEPAAVVRWGVEVVVVLVAFVAVQLAYVRRATLASANAATVSADDRPELVGRVERLSQVAVVRTPAVAVAPSSVPNSFTVGGVANATLVVSEGLLAALDPDELDAVLAHELAHIHNRDATVMSVAYLLPTLTYLVAKTMFGLLHFFSRALVFTPGRNRRGGGKGVIVLLAAAVVTITVSAVFWLASNLLFRILSQYREYAADRGSAAITGDPLALASALETIDGEVQSLPDQDLRDLDGGVEALYIFSLDVPMFNDDDDTFADNLLSQELFPASHPPTTDRIDRLRDLAGNLET